MADTMTLQQRIAMLNMQHVRAPNGPTPVTEPTRPAPPPRSISTNASLETAPQNAVVCNEPAPVAPSPKFRPEPKRLPMPPPRTPIRPPPPCSSQKSDAPVLPPRRPSDQTLARRESSESVASTLSTTSSRLGVSTSATSRRPSTESRASNERIKAPAFDPAKLPPLPPKRTDTKPKTSSQTRPSLPDRTADGQAMRPPVQNVQQEPVEQRPSLPVRRPTEPVLRKEPAQIEPAPVSTQPQRPARRSALEYGMNKTTEAAPKIPQRPGAAIPVPNDSTPPPIPLGSRPDLKALQASKPKFSATTNSYASNATSCLKCRDFSGPDNHAARFPRQSIPSHDLDWLAKQLTAPFPSATDKARAIFTWLHHNIAYNVKDFFGGTIKHCTPADTMATGDAVCGGYSGLYTALCLKAGLECIPVHGHGKGINHTALAPGAPVPPKDPTGHAWNAVKIDNGEWKLTDPCWGAGYVDAASQTYHKKFNPLEFTMSNEDFGLKHFPEKESQFFRANGGVIGWQEYILGPQGEGEQIQVCSQVQGDYGIDDVSFYPRNKKIQVRGVPASQRLRFGFSSICEHWDHMAKGTGPPYCFVLQIGGKDGRNGDTVPFSSDVKGRHWWADVPVQDLGCPGQTVWINAITTIGEKDARGVSAQEYKAAKGRKGMSWMCCVSYTLV